MQAKTIIESEHRSLAAVLHGMLHVVREVRYGGASIDFALLHAMLAYVESFSERYHHPKEEAYLFERVALRCETAGPLIEKLKGEHAAGVAAFRELQEALAHCERTGIDFEAFAIRAARYASFHWAHMRLEEDELLPLAVTHLTPDDWKAIDAGFLAHQDPLLGVDPGARYDSLFRRIVEMAPPPIGRAPAAPVAPHRG